MWKSTFYVPAHRPFYRLERSIMQYRIKLRNKIIINRRKGDQLFLKSARCTLLKKTGKSDLLFLESSDDLTELINWLASIGETDVLVMDDQKNILNFRVPKGSKIRPYCRNGKLIHSTGKTVDDDDIITLSWNCYLLSLSAAYND